MEHPRSKVLYLVETTGRSRLWFLSSQKTKRAKSASTKGGFFLHAGIRERRRGTKLMEKRQGGGGVSVQIKREDYEAQRGKPGFSTTPSSLSILVLPRPAFYCTDYFRLPKDYHYPPHSLRQFTQVPAAWPSTEVDPSAIVLPIRGYLPAKASKAVDNRTWERVHTS